MAVVDLHQLCTWSHSIAGTFYSNSRTKGAGYKTRVINRRLGDNFNAWHCNHTPQIQYFMFPLYMTTANPLVPIGRYLDNMSEDLRRKMDSMFNLWPYSMTGWLFPLLADINRQIRLPLCDMVDRGDKYELQLEIPGIDKDKIDVKATKNSVETVVEQSEKSEEKNYVYNERSFRSFP